MSGGSGQTEAREQRWTVQRWRGLGWVLLDWGVSQSTERGPFYGSARAAKAEAARRNAEVTS